VPSAGVLAAIGNTPLIELKRLAAGGSARIVVKLESGLRYLSTDVFRA
jgi:cysteine synthase